MIKYRITAASLHLTLSPSFLCFVCCIFVVTCQRMTFWIRKTPLCSWSVVWCGCWEMVRSTSTKASRQNVTKHRRPVRLNRILSEVQLYNNVVYLLLSTAVFEHIDTQKLNSDVLNWIFFVVGNFRQFVDVISARTAVGNNKEGKLILFHVDGQTHVRGWEWTLTLSWFQLFITVHIDSYPEKKSWMNLYKIYCSKRQFRRLVYECFFKFVEDILKSVSM